MFNLIYSEIYKIFKSKVFYVISFIFLVINIISVAASINLKLKGHMVESGAYNFLETYDSDLIYYLILIFVSYLITTEYTNGTIRQMSCRGIARWKMVLGQYIAMSLVATILILGLGILNMSINLLLYGFGNVNMNEIIYINLGMICIIWGTAGVGTFLSYLFKNIGVTIIISILMVMGNVFAFNLLDLLLKSTVFSQFNLTNMRRVIVNFSSKPQDIIIYSMFFASIGLLTALGSVILFSKKDID